MLVVDCWLLVVGGWWLVVGGCWLLVVGCWLLAVGCWVLVLLLLLLLLLWWCHELFFPYALPLAPAGVGGHIYHREESLPVERLRGLAEDNEVIVDVPQPTINTVGNQPR